MKSRYTTRGGLFSESDEHTRGFRRIVILLVLLVTVPTVLLLAVGVVMLVFYQVNLNVAFGVMVVTIVACLVTGSVLALVLLRREARLSQLQSDFVSKVSHELRTPLTSIRLFVETLQRAQLPPEELKRCVDALAVESARLTQHIERLLDWGRMEAGKRIYEHRPDDVPQIVDDALTTFASVMTGRPVQVALDVQEGLPQVVADRGALVDALVNLLSNAYKYSGPDKEIRLQAQSEDRWVRISVTDNGIGIPHAEHRRIFQKFYRVDERLSRAAEGSGLGLAIVQHVVRAHGGRIEVDSEPGRGSTFTLVLPTLPSPLEAPAGESIPAT